MLDLFTGLFDTTATIVISLPSFLLCMATGLILGLLMAVVYGRETASTKSFLVTLAILPLTVAMVIMMVNGNIGAGVAVAGAFSLVRFRSAPGTAKEIGAIFIAMCTGLTIGMGYIAFAVLFAIIATLATLLLNVSGFGAENDGLRTLHVTIPEYMNYTDAFDDLFAQYAKDCKLVTAKTASMGSLYKLTYTLEMKDAAQEKALLDEMRCRNGNLEVMLTRQKPNLNGL